jgi:anion-transporting  ArsA/GET3 family ATPase
MCIEELSTDYFFHLLGTNPSFRPFSSSLLSSLFFNQLCNVSTSSSLQKLFSSLSPGVPVKTDNSVHSYDRLGDSNNELDSILLSPDYKLEFVNVYHHLLKMTPPLIHRMRKSLRSHTFAQRSVLVDQIQNDEGNVKSPPLISTSSFSKSSQRDLALSSLRSLQQTNEDTATQNHQMKSFNKEFAK